MKEYKKDTFGKACLKSLLMLVLLSSIGFVVSYVLIYTFERLFQVNNNYMAFDLVYKDDNTTKYFSSANMKVLIQTMVYVFTVFILFLSALIIYFRNHILSKRDSILYSLFIIVLLYASSFILIRIGIKNIDDVITNFNEIVLTYSGADFDKYLKKLSNLRILITIIYGIGSTLTCLFSLLIIRNGVDEIKEQELLKEKELEDAKKTEQEELPEEVVEEPVQEKQPEEVKEEIKEEPVKEEVPNEEPKQVVVKKVVVKAVPPVESVGKEKVAIPVTPVVKPVTEPEKKEEPVKEQVPESPKEPVKKAEIKLEELPAEIELPKELEETDLTDTGNINIASQLDEEEKRIVSEINGMIDKINLNSEPEEKIDKVSKKVSFVGQNNNKKKSVNKKNNNVKK